MRWWSYTAACLTVVAAYSKLDDDKITQLQTDYAPADYLQVKGSNSLLEPILKVRIPDTDGSREVQKHFTDLFSTLDKSWDVQLDSFQEDTPTLKNVTFTNIIATRDPPNVPEDQIGRLVLAAHYDSKIEPHGFIGATDSAFPCALLLYVAKALDDALTKKWKTEKHIKKNKMGLQIILFDGEEAYHEWTDTDSIYGARQLAKQLENKRYPTSSMRQNALDSMDTLVLFDLLGSADPTVPSYFHNTDWLHKNLGTIQKRLKNINVLKANSKKSFFPRPAMFALGGLIGDDHLPFLARGVPVLHLIAHPFPSVWHKIEDDGDHLDPNTMYDWASIISTFTAEYLELNDYLPPVAKAREHDTL